MVGEGGFSDVNTSEKSSDGSNPLVCAIILHTNSLSLTRRFGHKSIEKVRCFIYLFRKSSARSRLLQTAINHCVLVAR
jgi:hypothetical protein